MIALRRLLGLGAIAVVVVACTNAAADDLTGSTPEVPIPHFQYSFVGCLAWSCASGQCQNDPAVWGACCTDVSEDPEEQGYERPSCGGPSYCDQYPSRCEGDIGPDPGLAADFCFHANVTDICGDGAYEGNSNYPLRCAGGGTIDEFPECYPTTQIN